MRLKGIEIEAFRGYENKVYFDFVTQEGLLADLVVIYAPNGFGKTSFFDAVEWGLKDKINRFEAKILAEAATLEKTVLGHIGSNKAGTVKYLDSDDNFLLRTVKMRAKSDLGPGIVGKDSSSILRDYFPIKDNKTQVVEILPQNAVDEFVFSTSPEDRYKALTGFWDGYEDTKYYQGVAELLEFNNEAIVQQDAYIIKTKARIADLSASELQISAFNGLITEINGFDLTEQKLPLVEPGMVDSAEKFERLKAGYLKLMASFQTLQGEKRRNWERIESARNDYGSYKADIKEREELEKQVKFNKVMLDNFAKRARSIVELESLKSDENVVKARNADISFMIANQADYQQVVHELNTYRTELSALIQRNVAIADEIQVLRQNIFELSLKNAEIKKQAEDIGFENTYLERSQLLYERNLFLKAHSSKRIVLAQKILDHIAMEITGLQSQQLGVSSRLNFTVDDILLRFEDPTLSTEIKIIKATSDELSALEKNLASNEEKYFRSGSLNENLQRILNFGKDYIKETKTSTCPLCASEFQDFQDLLSVISRQKEDVLGLEELRSRIDEDQKKSSELKDRLTQEAELIKIVFRDRLEVLSRDITLLQVREHKFRTLKKYYQDQLSIANQDIAALERTVAVEALTHEAINNRIETNIKKLNEIKIQRQHGEGQEVLVKETLGELVNNRDKNIDRIKQLEGLQAAASAGDAYGRILEIIQNFGLTALDEAQLMKLKISDEEQQARLASEIEALTDYVSKLDVELQGSSETELSGLKSNLHDLIARLDARINAFDSRIEVLAKDFTLLPSDDILIALGTIKLTIDKEELEVRNLIENLNELLGRLDIIEKNVGLQVARLELVEQESRLEKLKLATIELENLKSKVKAFIDAKVNSVFNQQIINDIYRKIDPHPELKEVKLDLDFSELKPKLTIKARDLDGDAEVDPVLYLSSAQINVLSLSIFLAKALQNSETLIDTIFMDDPIQYLDSINILSFMDLIRLIVSGEAINRQLVFSTHDENFFKLLKKKFDPKYYHSKFIEFESYGRPKEG